MSPPLQHDLGRPQLGGLFHPLDDLVDRQREGLFVLGALVKRTEFAADRTHVGEADVTVNDKRREFVTDHLPTPLVGNPAHLVKRRFVMKKNGFLGTETFPVGGLP